MTNREALHRSVLESPSDDTIRLVYADCLQESGKPADVARAEFIRLQVAGKPEASQLLKKYAARWLPRPLRPREPAGAIGMSVTGRDVHTSNLDCMGWITFEKGFIACVEANLPIEYDYHSARERFAKQVQAVFASHPLARVNLSFHGYPQTLTARITREPGHWRIGWDDEDTTASLYNTGTMAIADRTRAGFAKVIPEWLAAALTPIRDEIIREATLGNDADVIFASQPYDPMSDDDDEIPF